MSGCIFKNANEALLEAQRAHSEGNEDLARQATSEALARYYELKESSIDELLTLSYLLFGNLYLSNPPEIDKPWQGEWSASGSYYLRHVGNKESCHLQLCGAGARGVIAQEKISAPILCCGFLKSQRGEGPEEALAVFSHKSQILQLCRWHEWNGFSFQQLPDSASLNGMEACKPLAFSPKGRHLFLPLKRADETRPTKFILCDLRKDETKELSFQTKGTLRVGFSPDGTLLGLVPVHACGDQDETPTVVIELSTGKVQKLLHKDVARGMAWSPCGRYLALYVEPFLYRGIIRVFDVATGKLLSESHELRDPDEDHSCANSVYYSAADHDRSSTLYWHESGDKLYIYDRDKKHYLEMKVPGNVVQVTSEVAHIEARDNRAVEDSRCSSFPLPQGIPDFDLRLQEGRYALFTFKNLQAVLWDLEEACLLFRGALPTQLKKEWVSIPDSGKIVIVNDGKNPWLLHVAQGRVETLLENPSLKAALDLHLRPGCSDVAVLTKNELFLFNLEEETVSWQKQIEFGDKSCALWAPDGVTLLLFELKHNRVALLDGAEGYELAHWSWHYGSPKKVSFFSQSKRQEHSFLVTTSIGSVLLNPRMTKAKLIDESGLPVESDELSLSERVSDFINKLFGQ